MRDTAHMMRVARWATARCGCLYVLMPVCAHGRGCHAQFEFLAMQKLENNPMAGLYNTSEDLWMGKVRGVTRFRSLLCGLAAWSNTGPVSALGAC